MPQAVATLDAKAIALRESSDDKRAAAETRLAEIRNASVDSITDTRALVARAVNLPNLPPSDRVQLVALTSNGEMPLRIMDGAHRQLAEKTGIDWGYYKKMLDVAPDLAATNIQHWLQKAPARRLIRLLSGITAADKAALGSVGAIYNVRAILSDRFRPLDNITLLQTALAEFARVGAYITDWGLDEQRFYLRASSDPRDTAAILADKREPGNHTFVNERIAFGVAIKNSETGHSMLDVDPWALILRCLNGLIAMQSLGIVHVGRKAEEDGIWQSDTRRLDDAATFLKVRDRIRVAFDEPSVVRVANAIETGAAPLALPAGQPMFEFVGNVGRKYDLNEREVEILKEEVGHELGETGRPMSRFAFSQGVTATARRIGDEGNVGRRAELEAAGWKVLTSTTAALLKAGEADVAAARKRRN